MDSRDLQALVQASHGRTFRQDVVPAEAGQSTRLEGIPPHAPASVRCRARPFLAGLGDARQLLGPTTSENANVTLSRMAESAALSPEGGLVTSRPIANAWLLERQSVKTPATPVSDVPIHFIWVVDCSTSITGNGRMADVDRIVVDSLPTLRDSVERMGGVSMPMRVLCFSNGARWHVEQPVDVREFRWECPPLEGDGSADLGAAFDQLAVAFQTETMGRRGLPPLLVLLTDGFYEWARADGEQFGSERIRDLVRKHRHAPAAELIGLLHRAVVDFSAGTPQGDDLTAVIVKRQ